MEFQERERGTVGPGERDTGHVIGCAGSAADDRLNSPQTGRRSAPGDIRDCGWRAGEHCESGRGSSSQTAQPSAGLSDTFGHYNMSGGVIVQPAARRRR